MEWNVYTKGRWIGTVHEADETLARCAALSQFGVEEDEPVNSPQNCIFPADDFSVSRR